jgi:hypothetical protein
MVVSRSGRRWFCLPSRLALILGMGALSTTGAQAEMADRNELNSSDGTLVRAEAGRIYLTEGGRETELRLSASPERDHLLRLLQEHGSAGVKLDRDPRLIMSGGGGTGFYWWGTKKPVSDKQTQPLRNTPRLPASPTPSLDPGANPAPTPGGHYAPIDKKG